VIFRSVFLLTSLWRDLHGSPSRLNHQPIILLLHRISLTFPKVPPGLTHFLSILKRIAKRAEFYGLPLSTKRNFSENKVSYALRIKMLYPNLSMSNTAKIVGVRACELWHLPVFNELTESGAAAQWLMPREPDESDHEYVSRLRSIFPDPELTVKDLCRLSGVQERRMRTMPEFLTLSSSAQAAIDAIKKSSDESSRDYAVRLTKNFSGLRKRDLSCISGLSLRELRNTPELRELSPTAQAARMACPKTDDENMSAYARRIKLAHPHLTILECSSLSGTDPYNLRRMKVFIGSKPEWRCRACRGNATRISPDELKPVILS
jgi:hypothetical protein